MTTTTPPTTPPPYGGPWPPQQVPPAPPAAPVAAPVAMQRWRRRTTALLLAGALGAGATGAGVTLLATGGDDPAPAATTVISRAGGAATTAPAGSAEAAAATIAPSVVTISVTGREAVAGPFGQASSRTVQGTGSGVVLSTDGYVVTNNHVVAPAVDGGTVVVRFSDGREAPAEVVGTDPTSDLAVVRVAPSDDLVAAVFADSDELAVGQSVLAVGAPLGLSNTVTEGIVSTLGRPVRTGEDAGEQSVIDAVQTDAAIDPGNSGGALVDLQGRVVGINSAIATTGDSTGNVGVGFSIPSNDATEVAQEIIDTGAATHPQLGVQVADTGDGRGAAVAAVSGPAAAAGLAEGDVITSVGGRAVTGADGLVVAVRDHEPGDEVEVVWERDGAEQRGTATLAAATAD